MSRSRLLAFGGVAAVAVGIVWAVTNALATASRVPAGAAAAEATSVTRSVSVGGATMHMTTKPSGAVCYAAPGLSSCASSLADSHLSYATGRLHGRVVLGGVAGSKVTGVIARLTRGGTVWPELHEGAFYAVLPDGYRVRTIVKVLAGGRRVAFST